MREGIEGREFTRQELARLTGLDRSWLLRVLRRLRLIPQKPLYLGCKGLVFDVSRAPELYGPGAPYHCLVGRDASRALATMRLDAEQGNGDLEGLGSSELATLDNWQRKFEDKYPIVGIISKP